MTNLRFLTRRARLIMAVPLLASAVTLQGTYRTGYYSQMDGKSKESLKYAAKECVKTHTRLDYYNLPNNWIYTDVYPDLYNGCKRWWEMYSNEMLLIQSWQSGTQAFSANKMQREHVVPKSWWKKNGDVEYTPAYTDMWNLYPSEPAANQAKSNYPFGEVSVASFDNGSCQVGSPVSGQGGGSRSVFEPADEYKGDFARTIFYMATVYDDLPWVYNYMFNANSPYPTLRQWSIDTLLQWARTDKVSQKEIDRNDGVEQQQGNRNPFIDFPELAEYIWGTRMLETFYISEQGGNTTPPITGDPEVTTPVNGESLDFGQAAVGTTISRPLEIRAQNLTSPLSLSLTGKDRKMFSLTATSIPAIDINSADVYRLQVLYTPTTTGNHEAAIVLYDGGLTGSIAVNLQAEGCEVPTLSRLTAEAATDLTTTGYRANWSMAPEVVDYYELRRVRYLPDDEETEIHESGTNSYQVTDREQGVAESYTVRSCRLGFYSEASNSITVMAESGADTLGAATGFTRIACRDGARRVMTSLDAVEVTITDLNGRIISRRTYSDGEELALPDIPGIFIATARGMGVPAKIINTTP